MSSILEALRELEDERRRTRGKHSVSVSDAPASIPGSSGLIYPSIGGLALGALVFGLWASGIGRNDPAATTSPPPPPTLPSAANAVPPPPREATPAPAPVTPDATAAVGPAWLATAEPPQARFGSDAPAPVPAAPAPAAAPANPPGHAAGSVMLESIRYAAAPEQRSVTLRLDGRRVTLRQGERSGGIEVQLIMDDGAYLNRGAEVFFAAPTR
jgi:hypothetical protein